MIETLVRLGLAAIGLYALFFVGFLTIAVLLWVYLLLKQV